MQRAVLQRVLRARVRFVGQQQLHHCSVLFVDRPVQRRLTVDIACVDVGAQLEQFRRTSFLRTNMINVVIIIITFSRSGDMFTY